MSFDLAWLDLREPADGAARDPTLLAEAASLLGPGTLAVDLGAGSGSTLRAFPDTGARWRLVDRDPGLLAAARARHRVETAQADLTELTALPVGGARLVTASALCDLVSEPWLEGLADRLAAEGCAFYAALTYDGTMVWQPRHALDAAVTAAFNAHQRRDKGFGPALGPAAAAALLEAFGRRGFELRSAPSPWRLGPGDAALQRALCEGIVAAAAETGLAAAAEWGQARRAASGAASCTVGHVDVLALPADTNAQSNSTSVPSP